MLYVFLVNTGEMLTLDMALTMESVQQLHEALVHDYGIPLEKQVLLISGGQNLDPQMRVCSYSAGTDTNPIFLFSKGTIESANPPVVTSMSQAGEDNLRLQVEGLKNLPPSYSAVVARTQLALQFHEVAKEKLRLCESLIHNQHLQQQGWMAVIANLDDITSAFQQRAQVFQQNMVDFLKERPNYVQRLEEFTHILSLLEKTPLLPCLQGGDRSSSSSEEGEPQGGEVTLMMWISRQDQRSTLHQMAGQCTKMVEQFSQPVLDTISGEIKTCLEAVSNPGMKEIKGLGERLFGLEQLLLQARRLLTEQAEMAQGLVQNQTRASNVKDPSVLPDLCLSHQQQLTVMYKKHLQLAEMSRRCEVAKEELCQNLHVRLRWVMYVEQQISSSHSKMVVYHENLKRLRKRLEIIRQVCQTPSLYAKAVVEVCRRRCYDAQYHQWAGRVSQTSHGEHDSEIRRRKNFAALMQNHFLNALFPGFYEMPPTFATTPPGNYDDSLPKIVEQDIILLRDKVPELADILELPSDRHFSLDTSVSTQQLPPRPICFEIETQTDLASLEPESHQELTSLEDIPAQGPAKATGTPSTDSQSTSSNTVTEEPVGISAAALPEDPPRERRLSQPKMLSLEQGALMSPLGEQWDFSSPKCESFYRDAPFASLLPDGVDSEFHSAIGSPMDEESLARSRAKMDQILPAALAPMEENQTLREQLRDQERVLEELEQKKAALELKLSDSECKIGNLQESISCNSQRLEESQNMVECLQDVVQTHVRELRTKCDCIRKSVSDTWTQMQKEVDDFRQKVSEQSLLVANEFQAARLLAVKQATDRLQTEFDREKAELTANLIEQGAKLAAADQRLRGLQREVRARESSAEMLKSKHQSDLKVIRNQLEEEEKQMISSLKMGFEMEITDLEANLQDKEKEIEMLKEKHVQKLGELEKQLNEDKVKELAQLRTELKTEFKNELAAVKRTLQNNHLEEFAEFKKSHALQMENTLGNQKRTLEEGHVKEIESLNIRAKEKLQEVRLEMLASWEKKVEEERVQGRARVEEAKRKVEDDTTSLRAEMQKEYEARLAEVHASHERTLEGERKHREEELEERRKKEEEERDRLRREMEEQCEARAEEARRDILSSLAAGHLEEVSRMQGIIDELRREMQQKEADLNAKWSESIATETTSAVLAAVEEERREEEKRMKSLKQRLEEEKQEGIRIALEMAKFEQQQEKEAEQATKLKDTMTESATSSVASSSSTAGQQQVAFNKAVAQVAASKDKRISELEERERQLLEEQHKIKATIEKLLTDKSDLDAELQGALRRAKESEWQALQDKKLLEEEVRRIRGDGGSDREDRESPAELVVSTQSDGMTEITETQDQLKALLHTKEQECHTLKRQLMHMRTSSLGGRMEKVSISDISIGDLIFVFFQEGQENYMVYSLEPTLYFLHTESLAGLGLKTKLQQPSKFWTIARITDKEYCQAKKAQNRFKVPVGTKFYRVKAVRYDPKLEQVPRK
ncbi:RB1-inducible coiled-coil protein 1-like [Diadema antillarum]|uniref:RB1-inducible coiled-coil protein 1-like n=1 Tax=Diadema antillarum TaxID=105358 RepID=UPI003A89B9C0